MKKSKVKCPQCEKIVELDAVHSGGIILWKCCNCHHLMDNAERQDLEDKLEKEEINALTATHR